MEPVALLRPLKTETATLLRPTGNETLTQDETNQIQEVVVPASNGTAVGVPTYGGKYMLYNFYGISFEVSARYLPPIIPIGRGAYGIVCSSKDAVSGDEVAIKKIGNAFSDRTDAKRTLREIVLLKHMRHPNVVTVRDVIIPPNPQKFRDVYIVYELLPTDLHEVIRSRQPMDDRHFKFILFQLLRGLKYIHDANILHRDLKPSNILIDGKCNVKITDFGLARTNLGMEDHMTEYVVTRYYRAPELLLNSTDYTEAIDIWSVGCIFLELVSGRIALQGENYVDQLKKIIQLVGSPPEEDLHWLSSSDAKSYILSMPNHRRQNFQFLFPKLSAGATDLVEKILTFDPTKRISVGDAMRHSYLSPYNERVDNQPPAVPMVFDLSFEQEMYTTEVVRQIIYEQACSFKTS